MQDKEIVCKDCGNTFVYTASEQEFFTKKGLHDPVRCKECRAAKNMRNNDK